MDLRHLRTFATVAEQRTVSKAALLLRIAQPALSRQIKELEEELGLRLFDRVRRRLILTGEGEQLLADCRSVLGAVGSFGERAQQLRGADTGILRIAATPQSMEGIVSTFLHQYAKRRPNVQIKLSEAVGSNLLAVLERGDVHVSICLMRAIQSDDHPFDSFPLPPLEFLAACHPRLELGSAGNVDISKLAPHPLLLLDSSFAVRNTFDAACRLAGFKPNIFIESRSPQGWRLPRPGTAWRSCRQCCRPSVIACESSALHTGVDRYANPSLSSGTSDARCRHTPRTFARRWPRTCAKACRSRNLRRGRRPARHGAWLFGGGHDREAGRLDLG